MPTTKENDGDDVVASPPLLRPPALDALARMRMLPAGEYAVVCTVQPFVPQEYIPYLHRPLRQPHRRSPAPPPPPSSDGPLILSVCLLPVDEYNRYAGCADELYRRQIKAMPPKSFWRTTRPLPTIDSAVAARITAMAKQRRPAALTQAVPPQQRRACLRQWWASYRAKRRQQEEPQQGRKRLTISAERVSTASGHTITAAAPTDNNITPSSSLSSPLSSLPPSPALPSSPSQPLPCPVVAPRATHPASTWASVDSSSVRSRATPSSSSSSSSMVQCGRRALMQALQDGLVTLQAIESVPIDWQDLCVDFYRRTSILTDVSDADHSLPAANPLLRSAVLRRHRQSALSSVGSSSVGDDEPSDDDQRQRNRSIYSPV